MSLNELLELAEGIRPKDGKKKVVVAQSDQETELHGINGGMSATVEMHLRTGVLNSLSMARASLVILDKEGFSEVAANLGELVTDLANEWAASGPIAAVRKLADESGMNEEADAKALKRYEKAKKINGPLFEVSDDEESMGTGDPDALEALLNTQIVASEEDDAEDTGQGLDYFSDPHDEDLED